MAKQSEEAFKQAVWNKSRDNGRTPMQWDDTEHAGFTSGEPWFAVNPRYKEINVKRALEDQNSIFYYYKKLIELRHTESLLTEGAYELLLPESEEIFAYLRTTAQEQWLVAANLSEKEVRVPELCPYISACREVKIYNYEGQPDETFRPYEAFMIQIK